MSAYSSSYPDLSVDPKIKKFFEDFYAISDSPGEHEKYADFATEDGIIIMASRKVQGRSEIIALRHAMWQGVTSRKHKPLKIFPFGSNADELMLYGIVEFGLQNGKSLTADWGARAHLVKQGSEYKMDFYQVYTDTAPLTAAKSS